MYQYNLPHQSYSSVERVNRYNWCSLNTREIQLEKKIRIAENNGEKKVEEAVAEVKLCQAQIS